jgi:hypothetical protein
MEDWRLSQAAMERRRQFEEYLYDGHMTAEEFRRLALHQYDTIEELSHRLEEATGQPVHVATPHARAM